jgi:hypothetical protein
MQEGKLRKLLRDLDIDIMHKNRRGWLVAPCPFSPYLHEFGTDSNPSFCVKINDEGYSGFNCFTCHQRGNLSHLINRLGEFRDDDYHKMAIRAMIEETPDNFKDFDESMDEMMEVDEIDPIDAAIYLRMYPMAWDSKEAKAYLTARGIGKKTCELLDLRWDSDQRRVLFPVYGYDRELYGFTGRSILAPEDYPSKKYPKVKDYAGLRKDSLLLGGHLVDLTKPVIVVEGLFALAHLIEIGVPEFANVVATMGSFLSENQRDALVDFDQTIFLLYDDDAAGDLGLFGNPDRKDHPGAVSMLKPHVPTFVCLYPEDSTGDPDDLGIETVREMVLGKLNEPG